MTDQPMHGEVARRAVESLAENIPYSLMDCQAWVEYIVAQCGGSMSYTGSNHMARSGCRWLGTLAEARAQGRLVPGAGLFIHQAGGEPAKYQNDGLGNFSHVGLYVGENALTDTDKNGASRLCNAMHSSATMGRVAGSTLQNGWTHVAWFKDVDYDQGAGEAMEAGSGEGAVPSGSAQAMAPTHAGGGETLTYVRVQSPNGLGVRLREKPSPGAVTKYTAPEGALLQRLGVSGSFAKVLYQGKARYADQRFLVPWAPDGVNRGEAAAFLAEAEGLSQRLEELERLWGWMSERLNLLEDRMS